MASVGILALEVYFPSTYVAQEDLEAANAVSKGKYTIGLGQDAMAFTGDREDINSICLTVVQSLLEKYGVSPSEVGRLEVGTESLVDKSKSTKTVLMQLFGPGNNDIEGATVVNACYGGTAALLNALMWCDSSAWDGRYAIVVAGDIAVYTEGPARPTGGCGAVAMLVGRNAPLAFNLKTRTTHATHVWDFFKPRMESEYPEVDGALSETCYLRALDDCYTRFTAKQQQQQKQTVGTPGTDFFLFHSPYNKLVQKSLARVFFCDIRAGRVSSPAIEAKWAAASAEATYKDKDLETALKEASAECYQSKVAPGCVASKLIGNTYTASVWLNLACLVAAQGRALDGKAVTLFSYGSGALASMLEIVPTATPAGSPFTLDKMQAALDLFARLDSRERLLPANLAHALESRERLASVAPFSPQYLTEGLFPGTFFLTEISAKYERTYQRKPLEAVRVLGGPQARELSVRESHESSRRSRLGSSGSAGGASDGDDLSMDLAMQLEIDSDAPRPSEGGGAFWLHAEGAPMRLRGTSDESSDQDGALSGLAGGSSSGLGVRRPTLSKSKTFVWASGRPNVKVVVTGVAAALPGRDSAVFTPGVNNVDRILRGENCITPIPAHVKDSMLEKNVSLLKKNKDGSQTKVPIRTHEENINVCASLGDFSLTAYGVPESIASTMDRSVQVAVAAGLEALKDAGIVTGEGEGLKGWELPASMQDTTGVVYATSFPALDTAIAEVSRYFSSKTVDGQHIPLVVQQLRARLEKSTGPLSAHSEAALAAIEALAHEAREAPPKEYEFDRKFLFRVLVLGNAQLAQIIKARGPNMQTNAACAGECTTMSSFSSLCLFAPLTLLSPSSHPTPTPTNLYSR